mmetsp:Transcript_49101/g.116977  ORF Transcript_49101/g.116977 Transcript_49101/m.116977 type:complete len:225 (+) Transcript_49101:1603-2277(+)
MARACGLLAFRAPAWAACSPLSFFSAAKSAPSLLLASRSRRLACSRSWLKRRWEATSSLDSSSRWRLELWPSFCSSWIFAFTSASSFCTAAKSSSESTCRKDTGAGCSCSSAFLLLAISFISCFSRSLACSSDTSSSPWLSADCSSAIASFSSNPAMVALVSAVCSIAIFFIVFSLASRSATVRDMYTSATSFCCSSWLDLSSYCAVSSLTARRTSLRAPELYP